MIDTNRLLKYAINYLSKYSSSKANLEKILKNKIRKSDNDKQSKFLLYNSIQEIIEKLEKNTLINDLNYCSSKIRNFAFQGKSELFVKSYFIQKGIDKNDIKNVLEKFANENPDWELESAKVFVRKKRISNLDNNKQKNLSKLARAGFNYSICSKVFEDI